jgi:hypothetical protein
VRRAFSDESVTVFKCLDLVKRSHVTLAIVACRRR